MLSKCVFDIVFAIILQCTCLSKSKINEGKINDAFIFFSFIGIYDKNLGKKNKKNSWVKLNKIMKMAFKRFLDEARDDPQRSYYQAI